MDTYVILCITNKNWIWRSVLKLYIKIAPFSSFLKEMQIFLLARFPYENFTMAQITRIRTLFSASDQCRTHHWLQIFINFVLLYFVTLFSRSFPLRCLFSISRSRSLFRSLHIAKLLCSTIIRLILSYCFQMILDKWQTIWKKAVWTRAKVCSAYLKSKQNKRTNARRKKRKKIS